MEAAAHRRQFGLTGTLPGNRLGKTEAFSPSYSVAELAGSPGKPAASLSGPQSAFCRLHRGFFSRVLFLLHHAGWGKLETFPEHAEKKKILTRTLPPLCLDSLTGRPFSRSAEGNYYFWTRLLLFLFWFSLLRLLPGDRRGTLGRWMGAELYKFLTYFLISL